MLQVLDLPPYRPSEVLFNVDQEAYRDLLSQYGAEDEVTGNIEEAISLRSEASQ